MQRLATGEPMWDLVFDEAGQLTAPTRAAFLDEIATENVTDLFVFSHGWGTSVGSARDLYNTVFLLIRQAAQGAVGIDRPGFVGIYWPSLWFPDTPATAPTPTGAPQAGVTGLQNESAGTAALSGGEIAESLQSGFSDPGQQQTVRDLGRLIDEGVAAVGTGETDDIKEQRLHDINSLLRTLLPPEPEGEYEDQGETTLLLTDDPKRDYQATAEAFGSAPPGSSAEGIGDWFAKAINGAKDVLRVFSYNVMKARAGDIGRAGLGPLLGDLHRQTDPVRVHLIGHSFGARLVSFALAGISNPAESPVASLLLIQGAFSHWSFAHAEDNPFGSPGALNVYADRVHGPLIATYSMYDWAVGRWYPKASFLSGQDAQAVVAGRWDGMGADGYQAVNPTADRVMPEDGRLDYQFAPGTFYRVDAVNVINNTDGQPFAGAHSDICKPAIAELAVAAARAI